MAILTENNIGNLIGLVLCGGKSSRMGTDKGLIVKNDKLWAQIVLDKCTFLNINIYLSINISQQKNYNKYFKIQQLLIDEHIAKGPLNGLLTAHQKFPKNDFLLVACDMIDLKHEIIAKLISSYKTNPNFEIYAFHNGFFWEPMCAIYTIKALNNYQKTSNNSLQYLLNNSKTYKIELTNSFDSFKNYNYPNEV